MSITVRMIWAISAVLGVLLVATFVWSERLTAPAPESRRRLALPRFEPHPPPSEPATLEPAALEPPAPEPPAQWIEANRCRFLGNGEYLCSGPVSAPRCGLAVVSFPWARYDELMPDRWPPAEHEAVGWLEVGESQIVIGPKLERVELDPPAAAGELVWAVSVDLSGADVEVSLERPYAVVARVPKTKLAIFMGPAKRDQTIWSLLVRCY